MKQLINATTTPLASIFGSGFLVIVPILAGAVGPYSVFAMAGVCALAFAVGGVIRYNIANAEPVLAGTPSETTLSLERASDLALVLAYVISVCLYLHILSAFVLGGLGADSELSENLLTTAIVAGTLIVVQGFETPRYLGKRFDAKTRISASRLSQIISTAVYIVFVALALPIVAQLKGKYDDNSLIALTGFATSLLVAPLIIGAALSQFSAAVADTSSAIGNMVEVTHEHLKARWG